jgi:hypothetical protein
MLAGLLLSLGIVSSLLSLQLETSAPRIILLVIHVTSGLAIGLLASDRPDLLRVLARGAIFILPMFLIADAGELQWYIGRGPELWRLGPMTLRFDGLQTLGLVPRFPGLVGDANRTGFVLVIYWSVIARGAQRPWARRLALGVTGLFIVMTASRSTFLAIAAAATVALMTRSRPPTAKLAAGGMLMLAFGTALLLTRPTLQDALVDIVGSQLEHRVSPNEASVRSHIALIERGIEEGSASVPRGLFGIGYGNAYLVVKDFFPDNQRYGNFHSLYVTAFAEMGIFAFLVTVILLFAPVFLGGPWRPLVAGAIAFNIFYQTTAEPIFWFILAMAWVTITVRDAERSSHVDTLARDLATT